MPEALERPVPEKAAPEKVERFGKTVLSPEDVQSLKGQVETTLASGEPNNIYKAIDQLSHLKRAGVQGLSVRLNREKLAQQREQLQDDPQTLARYLVRMKYLGLVDKKVVDDISDYEKTLIGTEIDYRLANKNTDNFAELCVSAKHLGIAISQEAQEAIRSETEALANDPQGNQVDAYVKRRAQARYLDIELADDRGLANTTTRRLTEHKEQSKWGQYARLQALYTRATQQSLPLDKTTRDSLIEHTATLKNDPAKVGRYLSDLKVIEKALPTEAPDAQLVNTETTDTTPPEAVPVEPSPEATPVVSESKKQRLSIRISEASAEWFSTTNGEVGCGTDKGVGYGAVNEDAIVVNPSTNDFVVIDGMKGPGRGDEAAEILAESFQDGFVAGDDYGAIQRAAHKRMQENDLIESGAVFVAGRIRGAELQGTLVGDCRLVVIRNGKIVFATEDKGSPPPFHNDVSNPITGKSVGSMHGFTFELQEGDRIVAGSDGLFESVAGYAETFNGSYWEKIKEQFQDNNRVVTIAEMALNILNNKKGVTLDSDVYQQVRELRNCGMYIEINDIKKLREAGAVVADNQNAKLLSLVEGKDLRDALTILEQQTSQNMKSGKGKKDNRSILIYDIKRVTLPQAIPVGEPPSAATEILEATTVAEEQPSAPEPEPSSSSPEQPSSSLPNTEVPAAEGGPDKNQITGTEPGVSNLEHETIVKGFSREDYASLEKFRQEIKDRSPEDVENVARQMIGKIKSLDPEVTSKDEQIVRDQTTVSKLERAVSYLEALLKSYHPDDQELKTIEQPEKLFEKIKYHLKTFGEEYTKQARDTVIPKQRFVLLQKAQFLLERLFRSNKKRSTRRESAVSMEGNPEQSTPAGIMAQKPLEILEEDRRSRDKPARPTEQSETKLGLSGGIGPTNYSGQGEFKKPRRKRRGNSSKIV